MPELINFDPYYQVDKAIKSLAYNFPAYLKKICRENAFCGRPHSYAYYFGHGKVELANNTYSLVPVLVVLFSLY